MDKGNAMRAMALGLFILFVAALSLALVAGVRSYAGIVDVNGDARDLRVANGAIANTLHSLDSYDSIDRAELDISHVSEDGSLNVTRKGEDKSSKPIDPHENILVDPEEYRETEQTRESALVIREITDAGVAENRIYLWKGSVILEVAMAGSPYVPSNGIELVKSNTFSFSTEGNLVTITTDDGQVNVAMRSGKDPARMKPAENTFSCW